MYERFTDRARNAMRLAEQAARSYYHEYVGTEHILIGLLNERGVATGILREIDAQPDRVRDAINQLIKSGPRVAHMHSPGLMPSSKKVLDAATAAANEAGHDYVGTEHILLGLLSVSEGVAAVALHDCGVTAEKVCSSSYVGKVPEPAPAPVPAPGLFGQTYCKTCKFYDQSGDSSRGLCRVSPPVILTKTARGLHASDESSDLEGYWPEVGDGDWCGKHEQRSPLEKLAAVHQELATKVKHVAKAVSSAGPQREYQASINGKHVRAEVASTHRLVTGYQPALRLYPAGDRDHTLLLEEVRCSSVADAEAVMRDIVTSLGFEPEQ